ncbi:MAG: hypothetical protein HKM98_08135, partial [Gammaproteobacteria bacterium]|nr:hypothetical protein [Gammaproteobacteria bacterium]
SATLTSAATAATTSPAEKNTSKLQFKKAADNQTRFVSSKGDLGNGIFANDRRAKAMAFLQSQGAMLGIDNPAQLKFLRDRTDQLGSTTISYKQVINNVPVYGARINANFRSDNSLASVNGDFASGIFINTRPEISRRDAAQIALQQIASGRPSANLQSQSPELYIYRQSLRNNADGPAVLAWRVEVGNGKDVREFVFVNAANGKIVDQHTGIYDVLDRRVYDGGFGGGFLVWSEGDTTPFGSASIDNLIEFTSDSYHFFSNISDGTYLSWDGNSAVMHAVNNEPSISCPNARWNGVSIDFCDGTSSDDVVAHEWAHAYTERTHGLIYRWQSGALNEAYSDIFGEAIDFLNAEGTDAPDNLREVGSCTTLGGSSPPEFSVSSPQAVAGSYSAEGAAFNPLSADISGDLVAAFDGAGVSSTDGCESISNNISGAIAFIDRGECTFVTKVINAQNAGAIGVVIANNAGDGLLNMGGSPAGI